MNYVMISGLLKEAPELKTDADGRDYIRGTLLDWRPQKKGCNSFRIVAYDARAQWFAKFCKAHTALVVAGNCNVDNDRLTVTVDSAHFQNGTH